MTELNVPMDFTASAAQRVGELINGDGRDGLMLRVFVQGGGCSGFQYGFQLDDSRNEDDLSVDREDITMLVDALSLQYLQGSTVDYIDDLIGARFVVTNPNANSTCGCGASFGI